MKPLVTIVTPAYNQGVFLRETIESVLAQDYPFIEYIVIDDGSTDSTRDVMRAFGDRIRSVHQANQGQARTINAGVAMASGAYFGYLSSDDVLLPTAVSRLVEALQTDDGAVCAFPDADLIDAESRIVKRRVCRPFDLHALIVQQECYIGPGALYRTSAARATGGWNPALVLAPDREFWIRLSAHGTFAFIPETLALYRTHGNSISVSVVSEKVSQEYLSVLDVYFSRSGADPRVMRDKDAAYGHAHYTIARNCLRAGNWRQAVRHYREACRLHPPLRSLRSFLVLLRMTTSRPIRAMAGRARRLMSAPLV